MTYPYCDEGAFKHRHVALMQPLEDNTVIKRSDDRLQSIILLHYDKLRPRATDLTK